MYYVYNYPKLLIQDSDVYPAEKNEYMWPEKQEEIYYLVGNNIYKIEAPVATRNALVDHFRIPKQMTILMY